MKKSIIAIANWLSKKTALISDFLENIGRSPVTKSKYVNLAATDKADKAGVYSDALQFATEDPKVSNIALTGPYGSGKSSIIQSFLKKYRRPVLHISLASFVPDTNKDIDEVNRQEIERSILQQMLYGADADKLPLSRFKRIQSPSVWSIFKSLYITIGILSFWYVFVQQDNIFSGYYFLPISLSNWKDLGISLIAAIFLWTILHHFYVASFGLSLKSISLKDVEIKPANDDQSSILNRHLDEIIYFFQKTKYDLVIIEDLDRFNNPEIFITLREINSLVNKNIGVKRIIRFLYALRDDMFVNTERTKFFEFIVPVIPIINTSNSIDMVLKQGTRLELDGRLDRQFLREVSRYLNDLRLIQNIFNEYAIYVANLETDGETLLDANKLLAVLIYKNVYPRDFELLHRGEGNLAEILIRKEELIENGETHYKAEIAELEKKIEIAGRQTPSDLKELRQIYAMALIEKLPANVISVYFDGTSWIPLSQLAKHDKFDQLITSSHMTYSIIHGHQKQVNISSIQSEINSQKSYHQRKNEIENKTSENKKKSLRQVHDLRRKLAELRTTKLNELLRLKEDHARDLFEEFEKNGELARFLILEGYLDDTYYQYTSLFHSGRLSPNDNKFLIQIRAFITPEPSFPIDNPKEVIAAMRNEDFQQSYVLNIRIVDGLLSDRNRYLDKNRKLFEYISSEFKNCEEFFDAYYTGGLCVRELLSELANNWKGLVPTAIASPNNISHATQLVANLPEDLLKKLARDFEELPEFVSMTLPEILVSSPGLAPERLTCLDFEVENLAAIKDHSDIVHAMFEKGLYKLTMGNLEYIFQAILGETDLESLRSMNYTTIRSTNNLNLTERVERDFDIYLQDILSEHPDNSKEDAPTILAVLRHDNLNINNLQEFLERQTTQLPALEDVPEKLHAMLFELNVIEPTWVNCLAFMEGEGFKKESLAGYLDSDDVRAAILQHPIPREQDALKLRQFLFNAGSLSDAAYREYVHALPNAFNSPPKEFEPTKLRILIDERKLTFSEDSLDAVADNWELQVLFVAKNIDLYLANPDKFELDDDFREALLQSDIDNVAKIRIVELMDLRALESNPERAALIGKIISDTDANISGVDGDIALDLITHARPIATQISLLNKFHTLITNDEVRQLLANLPPPYSEIKTGYMTPRLKNSPENKQLVEWLDSKNIISSWSESYFTGEIRVNLFRR